MSDVEFNLRELLILNSALRGNMKEWKRAVILRRELTAPEHQKHVESQLTAISLLRRKIILLKRKEYRQ